MPEDSFPIVLSNNMCRKTLGAHFICTQQSNDVFHSRETTVAHSKFGCGNSVLGFNETST